MFFCHLFFLIFELDKAKEIIKQWINTIELQNELSQPLTGLLASSLTLFPQQSWNVDSEKILYMVIMPIWLKQNWIRSFRSIFYAAYFILTKRNITSVTFKKLPKIFYSVHFTLYETKYESYLSSCQILLPIDKDIPLNLGF